MKYQRSRFQPKDAQILSEFLNFLRLNHWTLTSMAYQRRPKHIPLVTPDELIEDERKPERLGTFLLKRKERIICMFKIDKHPHDEKTVVFHNAETHPDFQRKGIFWRSLCIPYLRNICHGNYNRIDATTWVLNRKAIPVYKRMGFRLVPKTSLEMENYLPVIVRDPAVQSFFSKYDFIRTLQCRRSYGYDKLDIGAHSVFEYNWKSGDDRLHVQIDRIQKEIIKIDCRCA
ncbi:MAG: GNAT family N-acetyltransferase [Deltaproteobacteria bacterium]|jgi:RimJ/RimL family protein N-acetyltransferase|nr:GNAT family N-acetyltransferase [Spirochaetales bacterium]MBT4286874.1 GNAT family N-acetyltransferase [Deltaproteobacteria bacterium]